MCSYSGQLCCARMSILFQGCLFYCARILKWKISILRKEPTRAYTQKIPTDSQGPRDCCNVLSSQAVRGIFVNIPGAASRGIMKPRASAEKFPGGRANEKKNNTKNSTIKPSSTLSVACMKFRGRGARPPLPTAMYGTLRKCENFCYKALRHRKYFHNAAPGD